MPVTSQVRSGSTGTSTLKPEPTTAPVMVLLLVIVIEWTYVSPAQSPVTQTNSSVYVPVRFHDGRAAATLAGQMSAIAMTAAANALFM